MVDVFHALDPAEVGGYGAINDFFFLGDKAQMLMDRMVPGRTVEFLFNDIGGAAQALAIAPDGVTAVVACVDTDEVVFVNLNTGAEIDRVPVGQSPGVVRINAAGTGVLNRSAPERREARAEDDPGVD